MHLLNKWYFPFQISLLFLIVLTVYFNWADEITMVTCFLLMLICGIKHYSRPIKEQSQCVDTPSNNEIDKLLIDMFSTLEKTFNNERRIIDNEINRTKSLLNEAVIGMNESFQKMKYVNDKQSNLLSRLLKISSTNAIEQEQQSIHQFLNEYSHTINHYIDDTTHKVISINNLSNKSIKAIEDIIIEVDAIDESFTANNHDFNYKTHIHSIQTLIQSLKNIMLDIDSHDIDNIMTNQSKVSTLTQKMGLISQTMEKSILNLSEMSHEMDNAVYHVVMSLQFEDITSQALASISNNIEQFDLISQQMSAVTHGNDSIETKFNKIKTICYSVNEHTNKLDRNRTVSQVTMEEGDIELF